MTMWKKKISRTRVPGQSLRKNEKGQVALFVALIFQVLFVFFAMIVNVGLLVHHKINLQNSVDLAAYYGAMKQAEMLNAVAHVNYQIRQSWKLMTFRYRQMGTAGATNQHPYKPGPLGGATPGQIQNDNDVAWESEPAFCIPYNPVSIVNQNETYCRDAGGVSVPNPGVPRLGPASIFVNFQSSIRSTAIALRQQFGKGCQYAMGVNWLQLAKFIGAYKLDIRNRKKLLLAIANQISTANPTDIDGQPIREGVYKTLIKNLTYQNQDSLRGKFNDSGVGSGTNEADFEFINSLAMDGCNSAGNEVAPPHWLSENLIFPFYLAIDANCDKVTETTDNSTTDFTANWVNTGSKVAAFKNAIAVFKPEVVQAANDFLQEIGTQDPNMLLYRTSIGYEKNPWCVAYVGVSAKTTPKIPFSPLGDITMKATAYAKPFGGRIGPWYTDKWDSGSDRSSDTAVMIDKVLPFRVRAGQDIGNMDPNQLKVQGRLYPNYSRYMGDDIGVSSRLTMGQFGQALHTRGVIDLTWYDQLIEDDFDGKNSAGDVLAWDKVQNKAPTIRETEIAAVVPDQFDVANYSIDPDFYNNYLRRLEKGYGSKWNFLLRGDMGSRMNGSEDEKRFSIRNQLDVLKDPNRKILDWQSKLTYYINEFGQLLTSWQQKTPDDYVLDDSRFGKCDVNYQIKQDSEDRQFTSGSCTAGGRTGYSVKLVDGQFLRNQVNGQTKDYELGGKGVVGPIKNPPPENF